VKPIYEFFRDYLRPPLKAAGFRRKGHLFYLGDPVGDLAMIEARSFPIAPDSLGFTLKAGLYPEPYRAFAGRDDEPATASWGTWSQQVGPGTYGDLDAPEDDRHFWNVTTTDRDRWGAFLVQFLEVHLIPFLSKMLDRDRFWAAVRDGRIAIAPSHHFLLLVDQGRTPELATAIARTRGFDADYQRAVANFLDARLPAAAPSEAAAFERAIVEARRVLPPRIDRAIDALERIDDVVHAHLVGTVFGVGPTSFHARVRTPDGQLLPCLVGPDTQITGRGTLVPIVGLDPEEIVVGSTLQIGHYHADEPDETTWA